MIAFVVLLWLAWQLQGWCGVAEGGYEWSTMSDDEMKRSYFPYERCVLSLDDTQYDTSALVFEQPKCLHHLSTDSLLLKSISQRCWLGGKQQRQDDGMCFGTTGGSTVQRGRKKQHCFSLREHASLWKHWSGLPVKVSPEVDFVNSVVSKGYELAFFIGDSMANQLGQRLLCNLLRRNATVQQFGDFFSMPPSGASAKLTLQDRDSLKNRELYVNSYRLHNGLGCSHLKEHQSGAIPGVNSRCAEFSEDPARLESCRQHVQAQYIQQRTAQGFRVGGKWARALHIFVVPIKIKLPWEYLPFAEGLLQVAKQLNQPPVTSKLVIVSPFAQHFRSHPLGLYANFTKPVDAGQFVCGPHSATATTHPDTALLRAALFAADPRWEELVTIKWFDATAYSAPMYDLHSEVHSTGWSVDCTHYFFQPTMMDALFVDLAQFIHNHL